jgi:hypothetical protein
LPSSPFISYSARAISPVGVQGRLPPADAAACSGRGQSFESVLDDEFAEELVEGAEHVELQASTRRESVDALLEHQEIDLELAELRRQVQQVAQRTGGARQAG